MFRQELDFFIKHQEALVRKYKGKILVIVKKKVVGVYKDALQAYLEAQKKYPVGTFMIQPCQPGESAYTVTIN
jgi:hypothetical protein